MEKKVSQGLFFQRHRFWYGMILGAGITVAIGFLLARINPSQSDVSNPLDFGLSRNARQIEDGYSGAVLPSEEPPMINLMILTTVGETQNSTEFTVAHKNQSIVVCDHPATVSTSCNSEFATIFRKEEHAGRLTEIAELAIDDQASDYNLSQTERAQVMAYWNTVPLQREKLPEWVQARADQLEKK